MHFKRKVIVFSSSWRFLLNLSSILNVYDSYKLEVGVFMYQYFQNVLL